MFLRGVESRLGPAPRDSGNRNRFYGASWPGRHLHMLFVNHRLKYVRTNAPGYRTRQGIGFGSSQGRVINTYDDRPTLCVPVHEEDGTGLQPPVPGVEYRVCVVYGPRGRATVFNFDKDGEVIITTVGFRRYLGPLGQG